MRVIAGTYGGRRLEAPKSDDIRPTSDKLRGSIFNALLSRIDIEDMCVLDICCGTGALGLEALSRGAGRVVFIDSARSSLDLAKKNASALGASGEFILKEAGKLGARPDNIPPADLFFCDPPYHKNIVPQALEALIQGDWLAPGALGVLEMEKGASITLPAGDVFGAGKNLRRYAHYVC
ncbi:MAG: 16S rRNA (guanine(966)-N(2))-methyltransferase RsmD [Alphaproteobacteria bacterium]|nr:16S rRNA (guanine(966)-N(2))-methyltransferase RsmD [Alphaproteobacteria bacterium]